MTAASGPPDLRVSLGPRLCLATPVVAASGGFGYGDEVCDLTDSALPGALITPTLTLAPRPGNAMPRTAETAAGLLHSLGWPNPGLQPFLSDRLPDLRELGCPVIASIRGETDGEWRAIAAALHAAGGLAGLELNLSALSTDGEAAILREIESGVRAVRAETDLPLLAKLPAANVEIGAAALAAVEAGADVISVAQGFPGVAVRMSTRRFRLPGVAGEVSGPCNKPLALYQVWRVAEAAGCPILASGGIMTGEDALEFLVAGASAVAVGIASSIHPTAIARITSEIREYLEAHQLSAVEGLRLRP
jgi:dihydroorotate dehydrogenase (NAD+) catalytic subunit